MQEAALNKAELSGSINLLGSQFRLGWEWWLSELEALTPGKLLAFLRKFESDQAELRISSDESCLQLRRTAGPGPRSAAASIPVSEDRIGEIRRIISASGTRDVTAWVDDSLLFRTTIQLPKSAQNSLQAIVGHQIGRYVPLDPGSVCYRASVVGRSPDPNMMQVELTVMKRSTLDSTLALIERLGLIPKSVVATPRPDRTPSAAPVLWSPRQAKAADSPRLRKRRIIDVLVCLSALAAYALRVHRLDVVQGRLTEELADARRAAEATQRLSDQVAKLALAARIVDDRRSQLLPLRVLDELTRIIPGDSWVSQLALKDGQVNISGYGPHAADLIARLEGSSTFAKPRLRSPITLAADGLGERFDLEFQIREEAGK